MYISDIQGELLTPSEVAKRLGLTAPTVRMWIETKQEDEMLDLRRAAEIKRARLNVERLWRQR